MNLRLMNPFEPTMKLKRYPIKTLLAFSRANLATPDYAFGERSGAYQIRNMTGETLKAAEGLLEARGVLHKRIKAFEALLPKGYSHQFYGNYDCIIVEESKQNDSHSD